jgi:hypothetical protein
LVQAEGVLQQMLGLSLFREAAFLLLREDVGVVVKDLEDPATAWLQGDAARQLIVVLVEDGDRQTGGPLQVASGGAVLNPNVGSVRIGHDYLPSLIRPCCYRSR